MFSFKFYLSIYYLIFFKRKKSNELFADDVINPPKKERKFEPT